MTFNPASRKAVGLLILVFALGIGFGALGITLINKRVYGAQRRIAQQPMPVRVVARLTQDVNLTTDQQRQLSYVLSNMQNGYNAIRESMAPQFDRVREDGRNQIRQILTPDQLPKFEDYLHNLDEERRRRNLLPGQTLNNR